MKLGYLMISQVAKIKKVRRQSILKMINQGKIKAVKENGFYFIDPEEVAKIKIDRKAQKKRLNKKGGDKNVKRRPKTMVFIVHAIYKWLASVRVR